MNKKGYAAILDDVAREHIPDDVDLAPRILARIQTGQGIAMRPRVKILMAAIVALLVLAFLLVQVPAVAAAVQRMLSGFLPDIGLVDVGTTRVLAEPVSVTREGITVTVEQLVADSQRTVVVYNVDGFPNQLVPNPNVVYGFDRLPTQRLPDNSEWPSKPTCAGSEISSRLRLPDGTEFSWARMRGGAQLLVDARLVQFAPAIHEFPSVPADVNELTFIIPCLEYLEEEVKLPRNWEIPLALVPAPPDMTTYPVIEVDPMPPVDQLPSMPTSVVPPAYSFSITVDRVVPSDGGSGGGYRLYGMLDGGGDGLWLRDAQMRLLDANGQRLSVRGDYPYDNRPGEGLPFAFVAPAGYVPGQVTLVVDWVMADILLADDSDILQDADNDAPSFTLDIGEHPQIDQVWELDRDFQIEGYPFHIATARFVERNGEVGLDFQMSSSNPAVNGVTLLNFDGPMGRNGSGYWGRNGEPFSSIVTYEAGFMPSGKVTITIWAIVATLDGPWQTTVTLPVVEETPSP